MKISLQKKLEFRLQKIFDDSPTVLKEYYYFTFSDKKINQSLYKRFTELHKFLKFVKESLDTATITIHDLEQLPIEIIEKYISSLSFSMIKSVVSILQSFWDYFTIYSYNVQSKQPLFYRSAISEWKVAYGYDKRVNFLKKETEEIDFLELQDFKNILFYYDNNYVLDLDSLTKIENWKKNKDRNLAMLALLMGAGLRLDELQALNITDIDLRKKSVFVNRRKTSTEIKIQDFALPYLRDYISWRRKWYASSSSEKALFINRAKMRVSVSLATTIVSSVSKCYPKKFTATSIRASYEKILLISTGDLLALKENQGYKTLDSLKKIMIS